PKITEVVGTSLDKGVELDALAKMPEPEQHQLIERAKAGEQVSARSAAEVAAAPMLVVPPAQLTVAQLAEAGGVDAILNALVTLWDAAPAAVQNRFIRRIGVA